MNLSNGVKVKEAFEKIHVDDELKRNTKKFLFQKTKGYRKDKFFPYKRMAMLMACFLLVILGQNGYSAYFTSVSTISIDVNPSIELDINQFDKVIDVKSYNEDGDIIISAINIRFLDYREALMLLLQSENITPYLTQEQLVLITVFGTSEERDTEMLADLTTCTGSYKNVQCSVGNSDEVAEAHSLGLSYGKYKVFLELQALDPNITTEDIRGLTMRQIRDMMNELLNDVNNTTLDSDTGKNRGYSFGHGNKNRYGHGKGVDNR